MSARFEVRKRVKSKKSIHVLSTNDYAAMMQAAMRGMEQGYVMELTLRPRTPPERAQHEEIMHGVIPPPVLGRFVDPFLAS